MAVYRLPPAQFRNPAQLRIYYRKMRNVLGALAMEVHAHAGEVEMTLATINPANGAIGRWKMRKRARRVARHTARAADACAAAAAAQVKAYQVFLTEFAPELQPTRTISRTRFQVRS